MNTWKPKTYYELYINNIVSNIDYKKYYEEEIPKFKKEIEASKLKCEDI